MGLITDCHILFKRFAIADCILDAYLN